MICGARFYVSTLKTTELIPFPKGIYSPKKTRKPDQKFTRWGIETLGEFPLTMKQDSFIGEKLAPTQPKIPRPGQEDTMNLIKPKDPGFSGGPILSATTSLM